MRISHRTERKRLHDAFAERSREAFGIATHENNFASAAVALPGKPAGQRIGIERLATSIEKKRSRGAVSIEALERGFGVTDLIYFDGRGTPDAFHVVLEDRSKFRAANLANQE